MARDSRAARVQQHTDGRAGRLPLACRLLIVLTAISSAIEFCLVYFGPQLLIHHGWTATAASTAMSANLAGILAGRLLGAGLIRRPGRAGALLHGSLALALASVVAFWLIDQRIAAVMALFLTGTGIANLYPLALSLTLEAAEGQEDRANARSQVVLGVLAAAFPFLLGSLADHYGLIAGFALEPVLIVLCFGLLLGAMRARRQPT